MFFLLLFFLSSSSSSSFPSPSLILLLSRPPPPPPPFINLSLCFIYELSKCQWPEALDYIDDKLFCHES